MTIVNKIRCNKCKKLITKKSAMMKIFSVSLNASRTYDNKANTRQDFTGQYCQDCHEGVEDEIFSFVTYMEFDMRNNLPFGNTPEKKEERKVKLKKDNRLKGPNRKKLKKPKKP